MEEDDEEVIISHIDDIVAGSSEDDSRVTNKTPVIPHNNRSSVEVMPQSPLRRNMSVRPASASNILNYPHQITFSPPTPGTHTNIKLVSTELG